MTSFRQLAAGAAFLALAASPSAARAQNGPFQAGFQDGFFVQTSDGDNRLAFDMVAQTDARFDTDATKPVTNTFTLRKIRPTFTGRVAKYFDFKVMPDFGNGTAVVQDAYFDIRFSPKFRIRSGKDKTPIGYELLESDAYLLFPERALASSLVPNRDIGVQVQGDLTPKVFYAGGVFNGIPDGASSTTDLDTNNSKDLAGRVVIQPFRSPEAPARALNGLGFQVGGSNGRQSGALPSFKTSVGQTYFLYASGVSAAGARSRVSPAVFYFYKSFGGFAEYMRSAQVIATSGAATRVVNAAWEVTGSFLVTGETASYTIVRVRKPFDPAAHHWGALQLVARVSELTIGGNVFTNGLAAPGASRRARQITAAANWYPSSYIKIYGTFERTVFDGHASGARPAENVVLFRTQLGF
jgi:phosphate-selective porin OprO/OprP